jgi:hypothetical protein
LSVMESRLMSKLMETTTTTTIIIIIIIMTVAIQSLFLGLGAFKFLNPT